MEVSWLPIPRAVIEEHALVSKERFWHRPLDLAQGPDGRVWVLSRLLYSEYPRTRRHFHTFLVSAYTADGVHQQTREVPGLEEGMNGRVHLADGSIGRPSVDTNLRTALAVDADGFLIVTSTRNLTFVYTPELELVRAYALAYEGMHEKHTAASNFAASIEILPSGRWLCAVAESVLGYVEPSIAALTEAVPRLASERPTLGYVASLWPSREYEKVPKDIKGEFPYVLLGGKPFRDADRPMPAVGDCAYTMFGLDHRSMRLRALDDERFVASWYQRIPRSLTGFKKNYFGYGCFGPDGTLLEHVDVSKLGEDHPFAPVDDVHYTYAVMRGLDAITFKNKFAAYLLRFGGAVQRIDFSSGKALKMLQHFHLLGVTREGRQVWSYHEHDTLLWLDPMRDGKDFEPAVFAAAQGYRKAWTQVKKDRPFEEGHWLV